MKNKTLLALFLISLAGGFGFAQNKNTKAAPATTATPATTSAPATSYNATYSLGDHTNAFRFDVVYVSVQDNPAEMRKIVDAKMQYIIDLGNEINEIYAVIAANEAGSVPGVEMMLEYAIDKFLVEVIVAPTTKEQVKAELKDGIFFDNLEKSYESLRESFYFLVESEIILNEAGKIDINESTVIKDKGAKI